MASLTFTIDDLKSVLATADGNIITLSAAPADDESIDVIGYDLEISLDGGATFEPERRIGK